MDLLLDENLDLTIASGDLLISTSEEDKLQRSHLIVVTAQGHWKQWPLVGIGAARLHEAPLDARLRREIELQLRADDLLPTTLQFKPEGLLIEF